MKSARLIKIIACVCFVLITVALVVVWNSPATAYEVCIYAATPPIFWAALILSFVCGISIIVQQLYARDHEKSNLWVVGLILILLGHTALLSLWIIRGYALWCPGDPLSHLGWIQDIIYSGHVVGFVELYPITHIYLAQISLLLDINPVVLHRLIPLFFALLFIAGMYLLAKAILPHKGQVILATVVSLIPLHGVYLNLTAYHLSTLAFPLVFVLLIKSFSPGTGQWKALFIIMIFLYPVFHPVPGFILLLVLLTIWLPGRILGILRKEASKATSSAFGFNSAAVPLLFVWSITWISELGVWEAAIRNVYTLIIEGGPTRIGLLREQVLLAEGYGFSAIEHFFKIFGGILVIILLAVVAFPILWRRMSINADHRDLFSLYGPLAVLFLAAMVFGFLHLPAFEPFRVMPYVVMICTIFAGFMLYEILERARSWQKSNYAYRLAPSLVVIVLIALYINAGLKLHPSPYTLSANWQITRTEIAGMDWFFHNKDIDTPITAMTTAVSRFDDFLLTPEERAQHRIPSYMPKELRLPWHFGYHEHNELGESFAEDTYMVLNELDRLLYVEVFPEIQHLRFSPSEFEKL